MRFLVDNAVSPIVTTALRQAGHDAVHVRDRSLQTASDQQILEVASAEDRVIVSADTDFGMLLALRNAAKPSFVLLRGDIERRPDLQARALLSSLNVIEEHLEGGSVVVISGDRIRIRPLPICGDL